MDCLVRKWHTLWIGYHKALLEGCLCDEERKRIGQRIEQHQLRLEL